MNPLLELAQNANDGKGSAMVHAFGIGEKKGMLGNKFMKVRS